MQSWEWGEVKSLTGWVPTRLMAVDDGRIAGVMSVLSRNLPYINRPLLYVPRGPVAGHEDRPALEALLAAAVDLGREQRALFVKADPAFVEGQGQVEDSLISQNFRPLAKGLNFEGLQPRFVWQLPLKNRTPDQLMEEFHHKTRYNIRLAGRKGVKIRAAASEDDLRLFYDVLRVTSDRQAFLVRGYEYYQSIYRHMMDGKMGKLFLAEYQGEVVAGTMMFKTPFHAWYVYGASSNRHRRVMPNYLLQWTMIKWALEEGCLIYDFRGISGDLDPENPLYGLFRFKQGFGGHMVEYGGEYDRPISAPLYHLWNRAEPLYRKLRGRLGRRGDR